MDTGITPAEASAIRAAATPLRGTAQDYDSLLAQIGTARFVLLGEASHGTHEFYTERARITQRLIDEQGFCAVAVEADWPDAWRVNCHVRGAGHDADATAALSGFQRFPGWMWRNTATRDFISWLRERNARHPPAARVGWYGLDLYSLFSSIEEVLRYLDRIDPAAAAQARERYGCFEHYSEDSQAYGYAAVTGLSNSCERDVLAQLQQLEQRAHHYMRDPDMPSAADAFFYAQQNARLVANAEQYYRTMFSGRVSSWNLRDSHMADTLDALDSHLSGQLGQPARIVVWAHNSHLGDARATQSLGRGEHNLGQLARERHPGDTFLLGFSTYEGSVTAASRWDGAAERKRVLPALPGSIEALLHTTLPGNACVALGAHGAAARALAARRLERAIGVLYLPHTERQSHYFFASLSRQFDAVIHLDTTSAVVPLDRVQASGSDAPETFPSGV